VLDYAAGVLHVLNPSTGGTLWTMNTGPVNRFAAPALWANGVYVGTLAGVRVWQW
jgi:hypothetical protein